MEIESLLEKGEKLQEELNWSEAAKIYCDCVKIREDIKILEKAAWCLSCAKKYNEAIEYLLKLCDKEPKMAKWPYMVGYQYYSLKDWDSAIQWFEKALLLKKDYLVVKYRLAYSYVQKAGEYKKLSSADFWKALGQLKECIQLWDNFSDYDKNKEKSTYFSINFLLGKLNMDLTQYRKDSIIFFNKALNIKPNDEFVKYNLSKVYYLEGEYQKAKDTLPKSNSYYVLELDAYINAKLGDYTVAISKIKNLMKNRKKDYLYSFLSEIYLLIDDLDLAYEMANQAIIIGNNNHKNYYTLAKVFYKFGLLKKALENTELAIQLKRKKYGTTYEESEKLKQEINSKINSEYKDDNELLSKLENKTKNNFNTGKVKTYNQDKGFGYIQTIEKDIFFHISDCRFRQVEIGDNLKFEIEKTDRGLKATNIVRYK